MDLELSLDIKRYTYRFEDPHAARKQKEFETKKPKALRRDNLTCQNCGFSSDSGPDDTVPAGYMEVHHRDDRHGRNELSNLATVCPFCHWIGHVGFAAHRRFATIIFCPELNQAELNLQAQVLMMARHRGGDFGKKAQLMYDRLRERQEDLYKPFDALAERPELLGQALGKLARRAQQQDWSYEKREKALYGIRLFPRYESDFVSKRVSFWSEHAYGNLECQDWPAAVRPVLDELKEAA